MAAEARRLERRRQPGCPTAEGGGMKRRVVSVAWMVAMGLVALAAVAPAETPTQQPGESAPPVRSAAPTGDARSGAQAPAPRIEFEVVSVKPSPAFAMRNEALAYAVGGRIDGSQAVIR